MKNSILFSLVALFVVSGSSIPAAESPWTISKRPVVDVQSLPLLKVRWADQARGNIEVMIGFEGERFVALTQNDKFDSKWCDQASNELKAILKKWLAAKKLAREKVDWAFEFSEVDVSSATFLFWVYPDQCIGIECPENASRCEKLGKKLLEINLSSGVVREKKSDKLKITCNP